MYLGHVPEFYSFSLVFFVQTVYIETILYISVSTFKNCISSYLKDQCPGASQNQLEQLSN